MDCEKVKGFLIDYIDGDLPLPDRLAVSRHLGSCYTCGEELDDLQAVLAACRRALRHPNPTNRFLVLKREMTLATGDAAPPRRRPRTSRRAMVRAVTRLAAAAALVVALLGATWPLVETGKGFLAPLAYADAESKDAVRRIPVISRPFIERKGSIDIRFLEPMKDRVALTATTRTGALALTAPF